MMKTPIILIFFYSGSKQNKQVKISVVPDLFSIMCEFFKGWVFLNALRWFFWMRLISVPCYTVVVEKTSPPLPVEVAPEVSTSSASQVIAPTQVTGIVLLFLELQ